MPSSIPNPPAITKSANVKTAKDSKPAGQNTVGKLVPKTSIWIGSPGAVFEIDSDTPSPVEPDSGLANAAGVYALEGKHTETAIAVASAAANLIPGGTVVAKGA